MQQEKVSNWVCTCKGNLLIIQLEPSLAENWENSGENGKQDLKFPEKHKSKWFLMCCFGTIKYQEFTHL